MRCTPRRRRSPARGPGRWSGSHRPGPGGAAGRVKGGRHIKYPNKAPLANLHLTLLERVGVRLDAFADSQGRVIATIALYAWRMSDGNVCMYQ